MLEQELGGIIKARRAVLNITQPHLAEMAGISLNTLYKIETGQANPTIETVEKLLEVLGLQITIQPKKTVL